jgi:hypothetical protein
MKITVRIPDELARLLGSMGEIERRALEAVGAGGIQTWVTSLSPS